eukprot:CAMPEP_0116892184 /NCGR_PEP_ID=MMETSP0467-20121206/2462_1 /TAXON_ID=283647 /ORGANISM="Mesodinium pulex, Strain SPMC105" /LENGTH=50 /DNA_ID=CAMNT_0004561169 /DNA_START=914 /DNA_END=1063 /DNA_ORIENTATION=+
MNAISLLLLLNLFDENVKLDYIQSREDNIEDIKMLIKEQKNKKEFEDEKV